MERGDGSAAGHEAAAGPCAEARPPAGRKQTRGQQCVVASLTQRLVAVAVALALAAGTGRRRSLPTSWPRRGPTPPAATAPRRWPTLERHLRESPRDVDARLLYGLVLSWEGRYDDARRELGGCSTRRPTTTTPASALANIAWWNGEYTELKRIADDGRMQPPRRRRVDAAGRARPRRARPAAPGARRSCRQLLSQAPGHPQARSLKNRLDASLRPWSLTMGYGADRFSDDRTPWDEYTVSFSRQTPVGSVIGRASHVERFGLSDRLFEVEMYPSFRPGTYGFVSVGFAKDDTALPGLPGRHRPLSVGRPRLRSVGRVPPPGLHHHHRHLRRHADQVHRQLDAHRQGDVRARSPRARKTRCRSTAWCGATSADRARASSASATATATAARSSSDRAELLGLDADTLRASAETAGAPARGCCRCRAAPAGRSAPIAPDAVAALARRVGHGVLLMPALRRVCCSPWPRSPAAGTRSSSRRR